MRVLLIVAGAAGVLLGSLWVLQGLAIVEMRPVLCFANCTPLEGPSTTWVVVGALALIAGVIAIRSAVRRGVRT